MRPAMPSAVDARLVQQAAQLLSGSIIAEDASQADLGVQAAQQGGHAGGASQAVWITPLFSFRRGMSTDMTGPGRGVGANVDGLSTAPIVSPLSSRTLISSCARSPRRQPAQ